MALSGLHKRTRRCPLLTQSGHGSLAVDGRRQAYTGDVRVFLAGASGVIGQRLIPRLVEAGHVVGGLTRSPAKQSY